MSTLKDTGCAPKSTYGFGVFDKIEDKQEIALIKQMLADAFDCMQQCEDHIKQFKLKNLLPFSNPVEITILQNKSGKNLVPGSAD
jgi:hypothetical protein